MSGLGRLTAAAVLACTLNGAAAYTLVVSDAPRIQSLATQQETALNGISTAIEALPQASRSVGGGAAAAATHRQNTEKISGDITAAAARAAAGPASFAGDVPELAALSSAYTGYVAALEHARGTSGAGADAAYRQAEEIRTSRVNPALARLQQANAAHRDGAGPAIAGTIGFLSLTTLASLVALVGGSFWVARRTKRIVNPGLVTSTVVTLATSGYAFSTLSANPTAPPALTGPVVLLGGLTAAGLAWFGLEQRRREYR